MNNLEEVSIRIAKNLQENVQKGNCEKDWDHLDSKLNNLPKELTIDANNREQRKAQLEGSADRIKYALKKSNNKNDTVATVFDSEFHIYLLQELANQFQGVIEES